MKGFNRFGERLRKRKKSAVDMHWKLPAQLFKGQMENDLAVEQSFQWTNSVYTLR